MLVGIAESRSGIDQDPVCPELSIINEHQIGVSPQDGELLERDLINSRPAGSLKPADCSRVVQALLP